MSLASLRNLLLTAALLFSLVLAGVVAWHFQAQEDGGVVESMVDNTDLALSDIDYRHLEQGVTRWRLKARQVARQSSGDGLQIEKPQLDFFSPEGELIGTLSARQGEVNNSYRQVTVTGAVILETASGYTIYTEEMNYDHDRQIVTSPGRVRAVGSSVELTGRGMEIQVVQRHLLIRDDVQAVFRSRQAMP